MKNRNLKPYPSLRLKRTQKVIVLLIGIVYLTSSSVLPVYAALKEPIPEHSLEERTQPLIVPLQEEGTLPLPAPFYKKGLFWVAVVAIVTGVWCSEHCKPDSNDATVIVSPE